MKYKFDIITATKTTSLGFIVLFLLGLCSCAQLGSLQTARTLEPDEIEVGGALYAYGLIDNQQQGGDIGSVILPYGEVFGRYGITNNFDAGLKINATGSILLDGKFQFLGGQSEPFAMAIGAGFEYQIPFPNQDENTKVFRLHLPLYLSYHFNDDNAIYATPRFTQQNITDNDNTNFIGGAIGFERQLNSQLNGVFEAGAYNPLSDSGDEFLYQIAIGLKWRLQ